METSHEIARARRGAARLCPSVLVVAVVLVAAECLVGATDGPSKAPPPVWVTVSATLVGPDGKVLPYDGIFEFTQQSEKGGTKYPTAIGTTPIRQGVFTITALPGKYELEVPDLMKQGYYLKGPATFEIKAGPNPAVTFPVGRLVPLEIRLQDAVTRKPIQMAGISAYFGKTGTNARSDEDGKGQVFVVPGPVKVSAGAEKHAPAYKDVNVGPEGAAVTLELDPYLTLVGKVMASNGKPVTGVWAKVFPKPKRGLPDTTHATRVKDATFTDLEVQKGPCIVVVGADGLAPVVDPLVLVCDTERTYTLEEGFEVTFKVNLDPSFLAKGPSGEREPVPGVGVIDAKTGIPIFSFSTAPAERGKERVPVAEQKTRLLPGKYKVLCAYKNRCFVVEEMDLKGPRTVSVEIKKTTAFDLDGKTLFQNIRFPQSP